MTSLKAEFSERASRFAQLADHSRTFVWEVDADGLYTYASHMAENVLGYLPRELVGRMHFYDLHPENGRQAFKKAAFRIFEAKELFNNVENPMLAKDGRVVWFSTNGIPLLDDDGALRGYCGSDRDITAQHLAQEALKRQSALINSLLDSDPDIVFFKNTEGVYLGCNPAFVEFVGRTKNEIVGKTDYDLFDKEVADSFRENDLQMLAERKPRHNEEWVTYPDGRKALLDTLKTHYWGPDGELIGVLGISRDITERKQAEKERAQMQAQLIQAQKLESIGTLAAGVAHEINNPIMGIMGYAQLILDKLGPDSPVADYATEINRETERIATIVKNLLSFACLDTKSSSSASLPEIVETTLSLIRAVLRHDQITLEVDVPPDLPEIRCRPRQIQQVIMNLLTNARDALNQKYPGHDANKLITISAREVTRDWGQGRETASPRERWLRLTFEDHGPGIPKELRARIFEPFFTTKPRDKGTGLGLSVSYGIVKDHGGLLSVMSEVGQWTRVHMELPVAPEPTDMIRNEVAKAI
jgi:PAS domain S-box-containing protein